MKVTVKAVLAAVAVTPGKPAETKVLVKDDSLPFLGLLPNKTCKETAINLLADLTGIRADVLDQPGSTQVRFAGLVDEPIEPREVGLVFGCILPEAVPLAGGSWVPLHEVSLKGVDLNEILFKV